MPEETWREQSACRTPDGEDVMSAAMEPQAGVQTILAAKRFCQVCPVRGKCLVVGLEEPFGVWGGLSRRERQKLRQEWEERCRVTNEVRTRKREAS